MSVLDPILIILATALCIPTTVFVVEALAGSLPRRRPRALAASRPRVAIVVPAHDEETGIAQTLATLSPQLCPSDRLIVVADNCSDQTASIAASAGAEVLERHSLTHRGKGYALDHGVRHLAANPPDVVVFVDADCRMGDGAIDRVASLAHATGDPIQALYLMHAPDGAGIGTRIAAFAWAVKMQLRAVGLNRLGLPCQLAGTGMAIPWRLAVGLDLATGHIVEDMKMGVDLAHRGHPPRLCPEAKVESWFPSSPVGQRNQRARWEHGHLGVILGEGPRLLLRSVLRLDVRLLALTLDLLVPPLALLVLSIAGATSLAAVMALVGQSTLPLALTLGSGIALGVTVLMAWIRVGRHILTPRELIRIPLYALGKIPLYLRFFLKRQIGWVRTQRDGGKPS
jgi:cellulose synthase/poly-beta-1,6-N-acetylglucosamine synthase-like glycosyltransferase